MADIERPEGLIPGSGRQGATKALKKAPLGQDEVRLGNQMIVMKNAARTPEELLRSYNLAPLQILASADGKDAWTLHHVVHDAWFHAMWQARNMTHAQVIRWLIVNGELSV